jgi:hypothetical protein
MYNDVEKYVKSCDKCQRNKVINDKPTGLLQPLPVPTRPWESISLDFVTHLPITSTGMDAIMVVVDRFSKQAHFIPTTSKADAATTARLFLTNVYRLHGLPRSIVSDRDPKFTSRFWKTLFNQLGTKLAMSTANHPQTDGQTERTNRTLEEMLRGVIGYEQTDWQDNLPTIEFHYNDHVNATTGFSPFYINNGQNPYTVATPKVKDDTVPAVTDIVQKMEAIRKATIDNIIRAQERQSKYANQKRREVIFKVGDKVLLSTDHAIPDTTAQRPSRTLQSLRTGPYPIIEVVSPVAYRLALPHNMRIHPVIHVSKLIPYNEPGIFPQRPVARPPPAPTIIDGEEEYEVEQILDKRIQRKGKRQIVKYLVRWKGYTEAHDSWEPQANLKNAQRKVAEFEKKRAGGQHLKGRGMM